MHPGRGGCISLRQYSQTGINKYKQLMLISLQHCQLGVLNGSKQDSGKKLLAAFILLCLSCFHWLWFFLGSFGQFFFWNPLGCFMQLHLNGGWVAMTLATAQHWGALVTLHEATTRGWDFFTHGSWLPQRSALLRADTPGTVTYQASAYVTDASVSLSKLAAHWMQQGTLPQQDDWEM